MAPRQPACGTASTPRLFVLLPKNNSRLRGMESISPFLIKTAKNPHDPTITGAARCPLLRRMNIFLYKEI
jgi:hypothetical protein